MAPQGPTGDLDFISGVNGRQGHFPRAFREGFFGLIFRFIRLPDFGARGRFSPGAPAFVSVPAPRARKIESRRSRGASPFARSAMKRTVWNALDKKFEGRDRTGRPCLPADIRPSSTSRPESAIRRPFPATPRKEFFWDGGDDPPDPKNTIWTPHVELCLGAQAGLCACQKKILRAARAPFFFGATLRRPALA